MLSQYDPVSKISGIGPKYQRLLENLNIYTVLDLLNHIPFRYEDRTHIQKIAELEPDIDASIFVTVEKISNFFTQRGYRLTKARVYDDTGKMDVIWFNQTFLTKSIKPGNKVLLFGKVIFDKSKPTMNSPEWEIVDEDKINNPESLAEIIPIYPTTEGVSSKWLRKKIAELIDNIKISEYLPQEILSEYKLPGRYEALKLIHTPKELSDINKAKDRLAFDELLLIHLEGFKTREDWKNKQDGHIIKIDKKKIEEYKNLSSFAHTQAQIRSIDEILDDLSQKSPMNRLLQGDVGSGKTAVAEVAIFACLHAGFNALFVAPTQILAKQHYQKIAEKLDKFGFETLILTGDTKMTTDITKGKPHLVIATHAILHNLEKFNNFGLIVIDEQHKFGVEQRSRLIEYFTNDNVVPNLLTMTATPIPRSLALTLYGDLDLSVINEMPKDRKRVITWVLPESRRIQSYKWILGEIENNNNQVFIVCPFIQESDYETFKDVKSAETEYDRIRKIFPERISVDLLHGKTKNKEEVIKRFRDKETKILVATPVIEVGVDVPSANIMVIENPERFGLASLHQLRGRVGRGNEQGYCILFTSSNTSEGASRVKNLEKIYDGSKLAEVDMKIRGPGNIYGTQQHGYLYLKIADLTDVDFIKRSKEIAYQLFINREKYPKIKELVESKKYIDDQ